MFLVKYYLYAIFWQWILYDESEAEARRVCAAWFETLRKRLALQHSAVNQALAGPTP